MLAIAGGLLCDPDAFAQDTLPARSAPPSSLEESDGQRHTRSDELTAETDRVIVVGTSIRNLETESALPLTVYTAEALLKQGANTPAEGLRQLPSFVGNTDTENTSNGGDGSARINLFALGSANTLTIIDGRRAFGFSNINAIPVAALSRIDVLKADASAVYGSDAVAGVVNFILLSGPGEKPSEGAEINALYGNTTDTDAHVCDVYVRGGVTGLDGKVSIAVAGEYYSRANLYSRDRAIARTADLSNNPTGLGLGGVNNNSSIYAGRVSVGVLGSSLGFTTGQLTLGDLTTNQVTPDSYRHFDDAVDPNKFNFRAFTPSIPAMEKAMYYVTGRYRIFGDGLQLYGDIMYSKVKQDNGLAGAPFSISSTNGEGTAGLTEARASVFNPFGNFLTSLSYRLQQELGNRRDFFDGDYYRYVVGINGDFSFKDNGFIRRLGYDSGLVYENFQQTETMGGDATRSGIRRLIGANLFNPFIGQFAPITGRAPTYVNGVPTGLTAPYDNTLARLPVENGGASYIGHEFTSERDYLYDGKIRANLIPGLYQGGLDINLGYEHRQSVTNSIPDPIQAASDQLGFNAGARTKYKQEVDSCFGELLFPIITPAMNVPGIASLEIAGAYRYEEFDDTDQLTQRTAHFDNDGTPRLTLRYQPWRDLTLRLSWGKSFLSPTPGRLFDPVIRSFFGLFDPLTNAVVEPIQGILSGGNVDLLPERTDTYMSGVVWTPKFLPGFTATIDAYQVFTRDLILEGFSYAQIILTANGNSGGTAFSDLIIRDPDTQVPILITANTQNAAKRLVNGLDITATYELPTQSLGKFTWSLGYNHFFTWKAEPIAGVGTTSFLGNSNGSLPLAPGTIPWNKGFLRGEWQWKGLDFVVTGNYVGDFNDDPAFIFGNEQIGGGETNPIYRLSRRVPSYITLDLQLSYEFKRSTIDVGTVSDSKEGERSMATSLEAPNNGGFWQRTLWGTTLTAGVNNAFDRNPPTVLGAFNDNYDTSLYSIRNRYYYISINKKF